MYNQGTGAKTFQGKEGKSFKTERQPELGLDMTKYRMYDYALGRFTSIDPLADEGIQQSWTPYHYSLNSPIVNNDPNGDICPICITAGVGALIGAVAGASIAAYEGKGLGEIGNAALVGGVGGAIIGSGAGLLATGTVASTGLMSAAAGVVATNAAVGMVAGAAEETTKQVLDGKGMNTATIVKAATAGGAVNAVAGPAGKVLAPAIKFLTSTAAKTLTQAGVKATTQTTANNSVKAVLTVAKDVAKEVSQKTVENKVQDKLEK